MITTGMCVMMRDTDNDGVPDMYDLDSDNDGPDVMFANKRIEKSSMLSKLRFPTGKILIVT